MLKLAERYTFAELATGGDFFSMIYQMKRFQEIEVRWVMRQLLHGLSYLNSKGVAHRDLKPENSMYNPLTDLR